MESEFLLCPWLTLLRRNNMRWHARNAHIFVSFLVLRALDVCHVVPSVQLAPGFGLRGSKWTSRPVFGVSPNGLPSGSLGRGGEAGPGVSAGPRSPGHPGPLLPRQPPAPPAVCTRLLDACVRARACAQRPTAVSCSFSVWVAPPRPRRHHLGSQLNLIIKFKRLVGYVAEKRKLIFR